LKNGFTADQLKSLSSRCEYPGCLVEGVLNSDHVHGEACESSHKKKSYPCPQCYRGEVCYGHNRLLADLDAHPEWVSDRDREYLQRRPLKVAA